MLKSYVSKKLYFISSNSRPYFFIKVHLLIQAYWANEIRTCTPALVFVVGALDDM